MTSKKGKGFGVPRRFRDSLYKSLKIDELSKRMELHDKQAKHLDKSLKVNIAIFLVTLVLSIATIALALSTASLVDTQNKLLQRAESLEGPFISAWQVAKVRSYQSRLISTQPGWEGLPRVSICFRNDGKTSTGPVNIVRDGEVDMRLEPGWFENIPAHSGNCTALGIMHCSALSEDCDEDNVPLGSNITIPVRFECTFCKQTARINVTLCVYNYTADECDNGSL